MYETVQKNWEIKGKVQVHILLRCDSQNYGTLDDQEPVTHFGSFHHQVIAVCKNVQGERERANAPWEFSVTTEQAPWLAWRTTNKTTTTMTLTTTAKRMIRGRTGECKSDSKLQGRYNFGGILHTTFIIVMLPSSVRRMHLPRALLSVGADLHTKGIEKTDL